MQGRVEPRLAEALRCGQGAAGVMAEALALGTRAMPT
jgi:hypothetical protein